MSCVLAIERVSLAFGGVQVIRDVSFEIAKGEIRATPGPTARARR